MSRLSVDYQGQRVGTLAEARGGIFFEYDRAFIATGHELSPLHLPLGPGARSRAGSPSMRLPGLFEDSLPDQWGNRLMAEWFLRRGTPEHALTPLMKLAYVGHRTMGALTYVPEETVSPPAESVSLNDLYVAAERAANEGQIDLAVLAQVGGSAGGARPKALLGLHRTDRARMTLEQENLPGEFDAWIVKFDTSPKGDWSAMEEAYARMARAAGIDVPETRLLETIHEGAVRRHFAVKRFDRDGSARIHHHTLAAMHQSGGGDMDYSTLLRVTRRITADERQVWRAFRRAVFNVLASNRDDHGKNHGFLYRDRQWTLGPAYDLTFSNQIADRGLAVMGERSRAGVSDLLKLADAEELDGVQARATIDEVAAAIGRWPELAEGAGVAPLRISEISLVLRELTPGVR